MKSKLRAETVSEVKALGAVLGTLFSEVMEHVGHENLFRSCYKCRHWHEGKGCGVYQALPPVRIIVVGCDKFDDCDEIPF